MAKQPAKVSNPIAKQQEIEALADKVERKEKYENGSVLASKQKGDTHKQMDMLAETKPALKPKKIITSISIDQELLWQIEDFAKRQKRQGGDFKSISSVLCNGAMQLMKDSS